MDSKMESSDQHYNHPNGDSTSDAPTETWGALLLQFTQDTTLHGIQYVFKPTRWFLRRFLWFLAVAAALAGFIYINYINVKLYSSYPKKVNVEVSVRNNLTFPSVTICNYNFHRFSKVVEMGLFDTFYVEYNPDADESIDDDTYMYDRCVQDEYGACASRDCLSAAPLYHDISSTACERLCSTVHSKRCNGFWYQRSLRKCYIWELVAMGRPINIYIELPPPVELTPLREELPGVRERPPLTSNYDVTPFISSSTGNDSTRRENRTKHDNDSNPGMSDLLPPPDPPVSSADNPDVGNVDNSNGSYPAEVTDSQSQAMPMRSHSPNHDGSSRSRPQRSQDVDYDSSSGDYDGSYYEDSYNDPSGDYYDWAYEGISISGDKYSSSSLHCDYEYYARRRPTRIPNLLCKFESGKCPGLNVESDYEPTREDHEMEEPFIITEARNPPEDFSTHSVRGSYLYLFETDKRQGFHAVATTDLFYGEDVCLEFYYTFIGEGITELHVTFVGVDNTALLTQTFSGNHESMKWQRFYTEVPSGDQRLELRARRPEGKISSGLAIDDVSLTKCSRLELQSKDGEICSRDRDGRSYMGPKSVTQNGIPCYNSTCGNQNNELKPWCYTSSDYEFDYCNITHCACEKMEFQCKDSKICLPKKFQCDGQRDCHDYTDEYEICEEKRGINCDFQTEFACGYMVGPLYTDLDVMLVSGINNTDELGPKTDRSGARLGSFINVDAQGGREGDRMSYWSPVFKHNTTNHCLTFWMYSVGDSASTVNSLRVYLVDADFIFGSQVHLKTFYLYHESFPKWKRMNVFVPLIAGPEYYRFIWEYTMGFPFQSSLAIDKVSIVPCFQNVPNDVNLHALNAKTSFNCHNFGPSCSINQRSSSAHGKWKWVPRHFLRNITDGNLQRGDCGHIRVTPEGYFETPLYPDPLLEEGTFCLVHVVMMPGSSVSLKFPSLTGSGKIQISTEPPQSSKIISQDIESYSNESVEFHGVAEVKVSLVYEGFGNATSFRGFYTVTKQDVQDYILAAEYSGSFSDVRHTIDMFTDVMLLNEAHCMSFISHAKTRDVQVFLGGRKHVAIKGKRTLLAKPWFPSLFNITLPPGKYNIFISLTLHRAEPGIYAAVDGINVKRGRCQDISTNGNVTCDFSAMGQCGYIDVSSSSTRWTRDIVDWPTVPPRSIDEAPAMVLRHKSKWRSEVFADLLTPRFEVTKDACLSFSFSAANATTISISLLESVDQLSALSSAYIGDVQVQSNKVQQTSIPIGRRHHYAIFSVRKQNSNFIMIDDVQLIESVCAPAVSASPGRKKRSSLYNNATDIASLNKVSATISQAPKFGESSFLSHLSTLLSPARQTPKSYGQFQRVIPRYHPGLPYEQITSEIGLATPPLRRDLSGLHSVDEVFRNTAPEMGTFIHSCQFNAQRCEFSKIQVTPTDFGTCYTFNPDGDSYTVTAGTRNGLQLVLNTESYENIKGDMTDAGVKVHVHDKDDIPYVRYVGSAAALSTHTYMAVTLVESLSLGEPYGSCASNHLDMYPDHNYTKFRCNQQCVTEAMVNKCQCRDHYMPGNATYCSLHEHLKCHVDLENLACDCPNACKVTAFSTQASFSSLSKDGVSNLLKDKQKFEAKFHKALNYHYRMEPKVTEKVISSMDQFSKAVETLMMFLKREATFGQTSVTFLTSSALHEIEKLTKRDIRKALSFLPNLITAFSCAEKFLQSRETELEIAQHKVHRFHDLVARLVVFNETSVAMDHHLLSSMSTDLKETFLILTIPFDYHPKCFSSNITDEQYIPLTLFADKTIEKSCKQSIERVKKQLSLTPVVDLEPRRAEKLTEYWNRIKLIISDIQSVDDLLSLNRNCTNSYSSLLHDISDWQMSLSQHYAKPNLKADFVFEKEILTVKQISERFKSDLFDGFKLNRTTMIEAANNIASERFHTFFGEIGRFKKKLEDTHLTFLRQEVNMGAPTRIKSLYKQALHHLANLRPYVPKSLGLTSSSRSMELWRKPKLDLDGSKLVAYHYEDGEIWRVWPRTVNVQNFYTFKSHRVLQLYVGDFFSELAEKLDELEINYQTLVDKTSNAFLFLNKSMSEILQSSVIDEQFILNNFLKLDVYYGELTHELIEQTPAYTISNFFSDMGGYLGLLLGASVLTIFELLDVIFYNSFQKCHERGKRGDSDKAYV